ncbi:MAG: DUF4241 domain-containing protein [bacterium]
MNGEWEKVGEVGVDAGMIWIGDPCYVVSKDASDVFPSWKKFCAELFKGDDSGCPQTKQWNYKMGHAGLGVSVSSGYGDGTYDVFVKRTHDGHIAEAKVVFISDKEESDEQF